MDMYYMERLEWQQQQSPQDFPCGLLSVRVYFNHDSLFVEVLNAKSVLPMDSNGLSDPFVKVELLPARLFPDCEDQFTNVQKGNLNPVFDECFEL